MRWFRWLEPGVDGEPLTLEASEAEILENYFPYWCDQMRKVGKGNQISHAACVEDFTVVHWAWDATHEPRLEDPDEPLAG
jgi:hypothetical protein